MSGNKFTDSDALEKWKQDTPTQDNNKPVGDGRPKPCANIYKNGRLKTKKEMSEDGTAPPVDILFCPKCKNKMEFIDTDYVCHNCKLAWELPLYTREQALSLAIDEIRDCKDLSLRKTEIVGNRLLHEPVTKAEVMALLHQSIQENEKLGELLEDDDETTID